MMKLLLGTAALLAAMPALAQGAACDRADLVRMTDAYLAAQASGDTLKLPLADFTRYTEQGEDATMLSGLVGTPQKVAFHRTVFDLRSCSTFTELVITDPAHPYVVGTRLQFSGRDNPIAPSRVNEIESVITDKDDWLFNANKTLLFSKAENWGEIPAAERDSRATILAAANAYLDLFNDNNVQVPWGTPCARLEGGLYSGKGGGAAAGTEDRCDVGVPSGVKITERHYVVDEALGAVAVLSSFGDRKLPDVHSFRIEKGRIRYVHTLTVCKAANCGLQLNDEIKRRLQD